jgi:hypothetical protein
MGDLLYNSFRWLNDNTDIELSLDHQRHSTNPPPGLLQDEDAPLGEHHHLI